MCQNMGRPDDETSCRPHVQPNRDCMSAALAHCPGLGAERPAAQIFGGRSIENHYARHKSWKPADFELVQ
jgi:hypothetical protein